MTAPASMSRRTWWCAVALTVSWLSFTVWARPLALPDEGRYVGVAWEALRTGDGLVPMLNGLPFFHKPPLFYWITELSMWLFGANALAARAAPVLGGAAGALGLFWLVHRWLGAREARATLMVLLAMPLYFLGSQYANLDMLVAGCISMAIVFGADAALRHEAGLPHRRVLTAAFAAAGLGVLAKGLIGIVLPGLVLLGWLAMRRRWRSVMALTWWPGILLMVGIASPWFLLMQHRYPEFLHYFFVVQHLQRFVGSGFNNVMPFWFFPAVLTLASLPALPWLFLGWRRRIWPAARDAHPLHGLLAIWLAVVVVFFSLPQSKLIGYILPAVPPLAGLSALAWGRLTSPDQPVQRGAWVSLAIGVMMSLGAVAVYSLGASGTHRELARHLARERQEGEPVVMIGRLAYDVPFYARLRDPVMVVEDWNDAALMARDGWRKELGDTRQFAPPASATATFLTRDRLLPMLCAHPSSWIIGGEDLPQEMPELAKAAPSIRQGRSMLWHVKSSTLDCSAAAAAP